MNNDSSSEQTLGNTVKSIKLKQQIRQLKGNLEKVESNSIVLKDEVQNLRSEILTWLKRWQDLKEKKDRLKTLKKSWVTANRKLLKQEEQHKMESIKFVELLNSKVHLKIVTIDEQVIGMPTES